MANIIVVDDTKEIRELVIDVCELENHYVRAFNNYDEIHETLIADVYIFDHDIKLPGVKYKKGSNYVRESGIDPQRTIGMSAGYGWEYSKIELADIIRKPFFINRVVSSIDKILESYGIK